MSHEHAHTSARRPLAIALGLILGLMAGEIAFGIVAGSLALLADAGHMLTDAAALALALGAATVAHRPARGRWTFGFRRLEILAAHVNGMTLVAVGVVAGASVAPVVGSGDAAPGSGVGADPPAPHAAIENVDTSNSWATIGARRIAGLGRSIMAPGRRRTGDGFDVVPASRGPAHGQPLKGDVPRQTVNAWSAGQSSTWNR